MVKYKFILPIVLCIFFAKPLSACDICGCSSGNYFIGPFPQFNKHFFGMRYSFRSFNSVLRSDDTQFSRDYYQTAELLMGTRLGRRWQLLMFLPYNINRSLTDDGINQNKGLSDITLLASYNLLSKIKVSDDAEASVHQLWIGGGVKLPTGKFSPDTAELISSANMQPGTGSFDFLCMASYLFKIKSWSVTSNGTYKINQNASGFQFGNRFAATAFISRSFNRKAITFNPNVGLLYENSAVNKIDGKIIEDTGGSVLLWAAGLETRYKNVALGCNLQLPLASDLSSGQTVVKMRGVVQLSYVF